MPKWYEFFTGTKDKVGNSLPKGLQYQINQMYKNMEPGSLDISQNQGYQQGQDYLNRILGNDPGAYAAFEAPLMENFQQNVLPQIGERFAGAGTGAGAASSSGLNNSLAQAGRSYANDIGQLRSSLQSNAAQQQLGYSQQPISNAQNFGGLYSNAQTFQPGKEGFFQNAGKGVLGGFGQQAGLSGGGMDTSALMRAINPYLPLYGGV